MSLFRQVVAEIYSMFAGDAVMTVFAVSFVAMASALRVLTPIPPTAIGFALFAACVGLLLTRVYLYADCTEGHDEDG